MEHILQLGWDDHAIPHKIWIEQYYDGCRICLKVVKDVEPEMLSLIVPNIDVQTTHKAWQGKATSITPAYETACCSLKLARYSIYLTAA
nr:hypothetical protein [Vibrio kanaloae]